MKRKYYVVWKGRKTGVFSTWDECRQSVEGFSGAKYKSYLSEEEAWQAYKTGVNGDLPKHPPKANINEYKKTSYSEYIADSISVDAACSGNPGPMEYKGVSTKTGKVLFSFGPITGTNNIGEFLAIVHGLGYLKQRKSNIPIYSDSETAIKWVKMKKANTSLPLTVETKKTWELIRRAEKWLAENRYNNQILKWNTELWGEIKADFGRK